MRIASHRARARGRLACLPACLPELWLPASALAQLPRASFLHFESGLVPFSVSRSSLSLSLELFSPSTAHPHPILGSPHSLRSRVISEVRSEPLSEALSEAPSEPKTEEVKTPLGKERHSLTLDQRRALRRWANDQELRPSHKACIEWFHAQFGQSISQSTVSHSLSPKYARLDGDPQLSGSRLRFGNWPDVERLALLWHQQMVAAGRPPTNEELAEKAKVIFTQLPRYKDDTPPEFSPGWIHRFKKRYGLLIRRQRRHGAAGPDPASDLRYLVDAVPRFMNVAADTSPAAIRDAVQRVIGVEPSLATCARVRDSIVRGVKDDMDIDDDDGKPSTTGNTPNKSSAAAAAAAAGEPPSSPTLALLQNHNGTHLQPLGPAPGVAIAPAPAPAGGGGGAQDPALATVPANGTAPGPSPDDDPETVLQNALRELQQEEADAETAARIDRERIAAGLYAQQTAAVALATPVVAGRAIAAKSLALTPTHSGRSSDEGEKPVRCPFCMNQRMLHTIKEAVEHVSTHVEI